MNGLDALQSVQFVTTEGKRFAVIEVMIGMPSLNGSKRSKMPKPYELHWTL